MTTHSHTNIPYKYASLHLHIVTFTGNRGELTQKITKTLLTSILELFCSSVLSYIYIPNVTEITNNLALITSTVPVHEYSHFSL